MGKWTYPFPAGSPQPPRAAWVQWEGSSPGQEGYQTQPSLLALLPLSFISAVISQHPGTRARMKLIRPCSKHNLCSIRQDLRDSPAQSASAWTLRSFCCILIIFCLLPSREGEKRKEQQFQHLHLLCLMPKDSAPVL